MKKIFKSCFAVALMICVAIGFCACKTKISATTTDLSNVKVVNDKTTNGGFTAVYGDYLYFVNGTRENDGTGLTGNKRSAICRIKYDVETGKTTGSAEVVVGDLVGFKNGSIYFFGDFMYYATPCHSQNYKGNVLYNKTTFSRYDLVNKKSYEIYTTNLNSANEEVTYAYYVVNGTLNLLVYESESKTLKSLKVDSKVTTNYTIGGVESCLFSETYGEVVKAGATVDANSFVYYTKNPDLYDYPQTGVQVYRTLPTRNTSTLISQGESTSLLSIRSGILIYAVNECVYFHEITGQTTDTLVYDNTNCISRENYENIIFLENYKIVGKDSDAELVESEGDICIIYFDTDNKYFVIFDWKNNSIDHEIITKIDSATSFEFIGLTMLDEIVVEDDPATELVDEEETRKVFYIVYKESSFVYKIELAGEEDSKMKIAHFTESQPIKLSTTKVVDSTGLIVPEIIGNYVFIISEGDNSKPYMYQIDLTPVETVTEEATKIAVEY